MAYVSRLAVLAVVCLLSAGGSAFAQNGPTNIKPWEADPAAPGHVIAHPAFKGLVDPADSTTWANLPSLPEIPDRPSYGLWVEGLDGRLALAPNVWIFKDGSGNQIRLPDDAVSEIDGKLVGTLKR